jgi:ribosomal protein S18 acetylase RimI-like enzyme
MARFERHDGEAADAHADPVWALYDAVFGDQPDQASWRADLWDRHRAREGFRLVTAYADHVLLGFGWAYVGERGQYWSDRVVALLPAAVTDAWVGGHLEVVELATAPEWRGQGIGGRLLDLLVADRGDRAALLSTEVDEADPAVRLYRSRGWTTLGLLGQGVQVMGLPASAVEREEKGVPARDRAPG